MPEETSEKQYIGKKVFFLYPLSVIHGELINEIIKNEYEVYVIRDHEKAIKILELFPDSILFVNIDTELREEEWAEYVKGIMKEPKTKDVLVGIISHNIDTKLSDKYLNEINVKCGFIRLKLGLEESANMILKVLEENKVKGRRKHVRAKCGDKSLASFNIKVEDNIYSGIIHDVSSVGMACIFDDNVNLTINSHIAGIQLRLKGTLCMVSGQIVGVHNNEKAIYIVMFDEDTGPFIKEKIFNFVSGCLQSEIDQIMEDMST